MTHDDRHFSQTTSNTSLPLAAFGLGEDIPRLIRWRVIGDRYAPDQDTFQPVCENTIWRSFQVALAPPSTSPPPTRPPINTPTPTETPTPTPSIEAPTVLALINATCRFGPEKVYEDVGYLLEGETTDIGGRMLQHRRKHDSFQEIIETGKEKVSSL